tara:strand:- start:237 stop:821 length:585 start_codon:yes stop_codon:yes gene_type:complete
MMTDPVSPTTAPPESSTLARGHVDSPSAQAHPELEAYWIERKRYLQSIRNIPELRGRYFKAGLIYLLRRLLWSFGFFPLFLGFWLPLVVARFNPVAMVQDILPPLQAFVTASPQAQASTLETVAIAWLSVGFIFAVFDFVLTPFKSPYEYEAEVHMRAWEQVQMGQPAQTAGEEGQRAPGQQEPKTANRAQTSS